MRIPNKTSMPVLVVAAGALVVGLALPAAGREVAHAINGNSIAKHSISGNRLKNNTVTGAQVKESTLGTVPEAAKIDGLSASAFERGSGREVGSVVTKPGGTATSTWFTVQDAGKVSIGCSAGPGSQPVLAFLNNTGMSQNMTLTSTGPGSQPTLYGPPFGNAGALTIQGSNVVWYITAISPTAPFKTAELMVSAYSDGTDECLFAVQGQSSLTVSS